MIGECRCGSRTFIREGKRIYEIVGDEHESAMQYTDVGEPMYRCTDCRTAWTRKELDYKLGEQARAERARSKKRWEDKKTERKARAR